MTAKPWRHAFLGIVVCCVCFNASLNASEIHVDPTRGNDAAAGQADSPLKSIGAALSRVPEPLDDETIIRLAGDSFGNWGDPAAANKKILLSHRMRGEGRVRFIGDAKTILDWRAPGSPMITVQQGSWSFESLQIGTRRGNQREGILVTGPAVVELRDCAIRTASSSAAGVRAAHGGRIYLYGRMNFNEDVRDGASATETFCGIVAEYHGLVAFKQREGASLSMGNGNLSASYGGVIELGCETAEITSWGRQSNCLAINNSGRIDLHNTTTTLCAMRPENTPIGLEHDGHILAEGAKIIIEGKGNGDAIVLQKASTFFCNDVEIRGDVKQALIAYSGSILLAGVIGDLGPVRATTGATIKIEKCTGRMIGPVKADGGGRVILPDGNVIDGIMETSGDATDLKGVVEFPPLLRAARNGNAGEVGRLLKEGADPNQKGPAGTTALHQAAIGGHIATAQVLIESGADARLADEQGRTPSQLARLNGHLETANTLQRAEIMGR